MTQLPPQCSQFSPLPPLPVPFRFSPAQRRKKRLAMAGLVLGISSFLVPLAFLSLDLLALFVGAVPGVVLAIIGLVLSMVASRRKAEVAEFTVAAALVLNSLGLFLNGVLVALLLYPLVVHGGYAM